MWLFTKNSFVSVVADRNSAHNLIVRSRVKSHLTRLFPRRQIIELDDADYRFRLIVAKQELADRISAYILQNLDYDNFKAAQKADDPAWSRFLHAVWSEGLRLQK